MATPPSALRGQLFFGRVPIKFDAVVVGVAEVDGFTDALVGGAFEGDASLETRRKASARAARVGYRMATWYRPVRAGGRGSPPALSQVFSRYDGDNLRRQGTRLATRGVA